MLRGARGNSGVILSLLFRGISKALKGATECDGVLWANALQEGVDAAYKAVMKPAEGTILTVARLSAAKAGQAARKTATLNLSTRRRGRSQNCPWPTQSIRTRC